MMAVETVSYVEPESVYPCFTWYETFTEQVVAYLKEEGEEYAAQFALALVMYSTGDPSHFPVGSLDAFRNIRKNLDNSILGHQTGARGGRPKKKTGSSETPLETTVKNPPLKTTVSNTRKKPKGKERNIKDRKEISSSYKDDDDISITNGLKKVLKTAQMQDDAAQAAPRCLRASCADYLVRDGDGWKCFGCGEHYSDADLAV